MLFEVFLAQEAIGVVSTSVAQYCGGTQAQNEKITQHTITRLHGGNLTRLVP